MEKRGKYIRTPEIRAKISKTASISRMGYKPTLEARRNMSEAKKGAKSRFWKGGITAINILIRTSAEYRLWRKAVFERDNHTCIWCGETKGELHADHIKPFAHYPELRFAIDNGRVLCKPCHKTTDTYCGKSIRKSANKQ